MRYFIYNKRWKKRLVQNFNFVYDNAYGDILRKAYNDSNVCYKLSRKTTLESTDGRIEKFLSLATKKKHSYRIGFDTCFTPAILRRADTVPKASIDACEAATFSMYIDSQMNCYPCSFGIWNKGGFESMKCKTLREIWLGKNLPHLEIGRRKSVLIANNRYFVKVGVILE